MIRDQEVRRESWKAAIALADRHCPQVAARPYGHKIFDSEWSRIYLRFIIGVEDAYHHRPPRPDRGRHYKAGYKWMEARKRQ